MTSLKNNLNNKKSVKKIRQTAEKYRAGIKILKKKLFLALKKYREAMELERVAVAKKRTK
jgi:hypothetical protein